MRAERAILKIFSKTVIEIRENLTILSEMFGRRPKYWTILFNLHTVWNLAAEHDRHFVAACRLGDTGDILGTSLIPSYEEGGKENIESIDKHK